ncbi:unnamed protein product [Effrenium voratum]|nr:unnamed protein product [Effrenium voratum]
MKEARSDTSEKVQKQVTPKSHPRRLSRTSRTASSLNQRRGIVPQGTQVTRTGHAKHKRGVVMVVKPASQAYVLCGAMLSKHGQWLSEQQWPMLLATVLALALNAGEHFGIFGRMVQAPGVHGPVLMWEPTALSWTMTGLTSLSFSLAILCMMTRVHSQLLWLTLKSFDPWAIFACMGRAWLARLFAGLPELKRRREREAVHMIDLVVMMQYAALLVLAEAADVPKRVKSLLVAICMLHTMLLALCTKYYEMPNWDPGVELTILFFPPMSPRSQFVSSLECIIVLLAKAAVSVVLQKNAFMFLRCHYEFCTDQLDATFARLAMTDPSNIQYGDFRAVLLEWGVTEGHIFSGFNYLDHDSSGKVSLRRFRECLSDLFAEFPDASSSSLLARFCQDCYSQASHITSLDSMMSIVFSHWRRIKLDQFGTMMYQILTQDQAIAKVFQRDRTHTQALLFSAFTAVALSRLEERDYVVIETQMIELGLRHKAYGVRPTFLGLFELALMETINHQVNGLSLRGELAWAMIWGHYVVLPLLHGLVDIETLKPQIYDHVHDLLSLTHEERFLTVLTKNMHHVPTGSWKVSCAEEGEHIETMLQLTKQILLDLQGPCPFTAGQRLNQDFKWDRILPRDLLRFSYAMAETFREILGAAYTSTLDTEWAVFMHAEVLEVLLLSPYLQSQKVLEEWAFQLGDSVVRESWDALLLLAHCDMEFAELGFARLNADSGMNPTIGFTLKSFREQGIQHPTWSLKRILETYCKSPAPQFQ